MFKMISAMLTCVALGASLPAVAAGAADMTSKGIRNGFRESRLARS